MSRPDGTGRPVEIVGVIGGTGGIAATYAAMRGLAGVFDSAAADLLAWSAGDAAAAAAPGVLATAPLSPATFAAAEAAVLAATTGPTGLLPAALAWEADALLIRAAVATLRTGDVATGLAIDQLDRRLGRLAGLGLRAAGPALLTVGSQLPPEARDRLSARLQGWAVDHPEAVQHGVNGGGGLLAGLTGLPVGALTAQQVTGLVAAPYGNGPARVRERSDLTVPAGRTRPRSVEDVVRHLGEVAALSPEPDSEANGTIEVQTLDAGTDRARHVVYLPGTDDLTTLPWTQEDMARDSGGDGHSAAGHETTYQRGILHAMAEAGIGSDEPVLLVGHSLGGMEAAALASRDTGYAITDVVTAGSPTAQVAGYPDGVHVLSLEHRGDVVPLLDGADNADSTAQTTVVFADGGDASIVDAHGYAHYAGGAAAVDASADATVADAVRGLHERGFLAGDGPGDVTSQVFQITRAD